MTAGLRRLAIPAPSPREATLRRHARIAAAFPSRAEVVLLGDSLVAGWPEAALPDAPAGPAILNLGMPGDRVQHTLWRLATLPAKALRPRWCLLLLGTNNLADGDSPAAIAVGLLAVLRRMRGWEADRTVLVGIPWRRRGPDGVEAARLALNRRLARIAGCGGALFVDPDPDLRDNDAAFTDGLHLGPLGYARLGAAVSAALSG